jgi:hypothetical protein
MPEPAWKILQCPNCAALSKCDPEAVVAPTCPRCGWALDVSQDPYVPDSSELLDDGPEIISEELDRPADAPPMTEPDLEELQLDQARMKRTTDDELFSRAEDRIRVKRKSERVEKELTSWDDIDAGVDESRPGRRKPTWLKVLRGGAIAAVPIALLCLMVYGLIASLQDKEEVQREPEITEAEVARESLSALEAAALERESSNQIYARVRAVAERFLNAASWQDRLALVREPDRVAPLMERFYADPDNPDGPVPHLPLPPEGKILVHESLLLISVGKEDRRTLPLALELTAPDEYRVDWESFVGFCEVPWNEIPDRRPIEPFLLRAKVKPGNFYNFGFRDDSWSNWHLDDRRGEQRLYGYAELNGVTESDLKLHLGRSKKQVYLLLKVRFPEDAPSPHQVEITEVIAKGWVAPLAEQ